MLAVESRRLSGEKVQWDRVAGECIDHQHVKTLRLFACQCKPPIAIYDFDFRARVTKISEDILRNRRHGWIDLVEANAVARAAIRSDCPRAQANHSDVPCTPLATETQRQPDTGVLRVVTRRNPAQLLG